MSDRDDPSRRELLETSAAAMAAAATPLVAGCSGGGDGSGETTEPTDTTTTGGGADTTTAGDGTATTTGGGTGTTTGAADVAETFVFGGEIDAWNGRAPERIDGQPNPSLTLTAGNRYRFRWKNMDGTTHQLAVGYENDDGELVAVEKTGAYNDSGKFGSLTVEATAPLSTYWCTYHPTSMRGPVTVE